VVVAVVISTLSHAAQADARDCEGGGKAAALDRVVVAVVISTLSHAAQADARDCEVGRTIGTTTAFTIIVEAV
jgi:hypothetical protein